MAIEDWIEKWTEMHAKEIDRVERQHGERMDKIEKSIEKLEKKIDDLTKLLQEYADASKSKDEKHAIDIAVLKTKFAFYAGVGTLVGGGIVAAILEWWGPK